MKIAKNAVVSVHYTLTDDEGTEIDSSVGGDPLVYLHGANNLIPGLEKKLQGRSKGDAFQVSVEPAEGYGDHDPEMRHTVSRSKFPGVATIEPGMVFQAEAEDGSIQRLTVSAVDGDDIEVDTNHPLAGKVLHFDIEIVGVRRATDEEIAHGHVH